MIDFHAFYQFFNFLIFQFFDFSIFFFQIFQIFFRILWRFSILNCHKWSALEYMYSTPQNGSDVGEEDCHEDADGDESGPDQKSPEQSTNAPEKISFNEKTFWKSVFCVVFTKFHSSPIASGQTGAAWCRPATGKWSPFERAVPREPQTPLHHCWRNSSRNSAQKINKWTKK